MKCPPWSHVLGAWLSTTVVCMRISVIHGLGHLNPWSPVCDAAWVGFVCVKEVSHCEWALRL